jgi:hypothetical protein
MAIRLRHVVKLGEILIDSGACLEVLGRFHCSRRGDVRTPGMDFREGVEILFKAGSIGIDHEDKDGETALSLAKLSRHEETIALLCASR